MLALHVTLLTDRFAATRYNDRTEAEWPPHPARIYSALVDALAALGSPHVQASTASLRRTMTHFVPVNDADQVGGSFDKAEDKVAAAESAILVAEDVVFLATGGDQVRADKALAKAVAARDKAEAALVDAVRRAAQPGSRGGTPAGAHALLPWNRGKQPRTFPAAVPRDPRVSYFWHDELADERAVAALQAVASRVVRVGHSSSFVRVEVDPTFDPTQPDERPLLIPDDEGEEVLRVAAPGQRQALDEAYARHEGSLPGRVMPGSFQRYRPATEDRPAATTARTGGRWIVYRVVDGASMPAHAAAALAEAVRGAVMSHAASPTHSMLSGHASSGPLHAEHLAFVPLPFVAHPYADGVIRGFALSLPASAPPDADLALLRALSRWEASPSKLQTNPEAPQVEVGVGRDLRFLAERVVDETEVLGTLQRRRWSRPSARWVTVTPIALDGECAPFDQPTGAGRRKAQKTAQKLIRRAVVRAIVLPEGVTLEPEEIGVELVFDAPLVGAAHLTRVRPFKRGGHARPRRLVHAALSLPFAVRGPLLLGAGRHFGLGLCLPVNDRTPEEDR